MPVRVSEHLIFQASTPTSVSARLLSRRVCVYARPVPGAPEKISLVIPTLNEAAELPETLRRLRAVPEVGEVIIADGGSRDATASLAEAAGARVVPCAPGRGRQLRAGAAQATGEALLFLHADTWLPPHAGAALLACLAQPGVVAGGFYKVFRDPPNWLVRGSRFKCWWRLLIARRVMADHFQVGADVVSGIGQAMACRAFALIDRPSALRIAASRSCDSR